MFIQKIIQILNCSIVEICPRDLQSWIDTISFESDSYEKKIFFSFGYLNNISCCNVLQTIYWGTECNSRSDVMRQLIPFNVNIHETVGISSTRWLRAEDAISKVNWHYTLLNRWTVHETSLHFHSREQIFAILFIRFRKLYLSSSLFHTLSYQLLIT